MREITFSPERALESVLYLAERLPSSTIHEVLKLRYFADKMHLAEYGFLASGDQYVAMQYGPVASHTYNMMKAARGSQSDWIHPRFYELVDGALSITDGKTLVPLRHADTSLLSQSDIECLDKAIDQYGGMSFADRTELSHDEAWRRAWKSAQEYDLRSDEMPIESIAATLENSAEILEHIQTQG